MMTQCKTTLSLMDFIATLSSNDTEHIVMLSVVFFTVMLSLEHFTIVLSVIMPVVIVLIVFMLNVVAQTIFSSFSKKSFLLLFFRKKTRVDTLKLFSLALEINKLECLSLGNFFPWCNVC
jgi:hypothetical protein